jgi:hypothetical protein
MASSARAPAFPRLLSELEACFHTEIAAARTLGRRELAEQLNQAARRLREAANFAGAADVLAEASAGLCNGAAVFRITSDAVLGERVRGLDGLKAEAFRKLRVALREAPALAQAAETGDPVTAASAPGEISAALAALFGHAEGERVEILPIAARGTTAGLLYTWGAAEPAALELLAQAAGLALSAISPPQPAPAELVAIQAPAAREVKSTAVPQPLDLKARRFARVHVAEMRLYQPEAVRAGRARSDLYGALRESIDQARESYRRAFLQAGAGVADYVHEELLRTLANEDPALLGKEYPGPLA